MSEKVKKRRPLRTALIVLGAIVATLVVVSAVALAVTEGERREGRNLPIGDVEFSSLPDGTYRGSYEGGRYGWRANEVEVTVSDGRVTQIEVVSAATPPTPEFTEALFGRVIEKQSLQVDVVNGASITSKAYLKSIENAVAGSTNGG